MDLTQLKALLPLGESSEVELKESFRNALEISKSICSFANTLGGLLILGVKSNGEVHGIERNSDEFQQKISAANQSISPLPTISIESHSIDEKRVIVVIVQRSTDNIYHTFQGAIYIREGSICRRLEGTSQLEFLRNRQILSFDEAYSTASLSEIDETKVNDFLKKRSQADYFSSHTLKDFLVNSKLATETNEFKIKNAAVLVFAKNPINLIPQCEVNLVRFSGIDPVEILAHQLVQDTLPNLIEQSISFLRRHISKGIQISLSASRIEEFEYPLPVIREAIVNAIAHRDYYRTDPIQISLFDNRIEITSPGSLPNGLPKELFGTISVQRNPLSYRLLRDLGYVEGLATGIPRMKNEMRKAGLKDPDFVISNGVFRIVLYNKKGKLKPVEEISDLSPRQQKAMTYIKVHKSIKSQVYAELNSVSRATAINEINEMVEFGYLRKIGVYRSAYYVLNEQSNAPL